MIKVNGLARDCIEDRYETAKCSERNAHSLADIEEGRAAGCKMCTKLKAAEGQVTSSRRHLANTWAAFETQACKTARAQADL